MCRFVVLFAVMCGMACGLWAAESEALDEQKVDVLINASGRTDDFSYAVPWSVAHLKTASGEPFSQAFAVLGHGDGYQKPFTSSELDDAIQAFVKDFESDDQKKEPNETHTPLKQSVKFLSSQSRWIWYVDGFECCWQYPFVPGSVRIFLRGPQNPFFEGFPAQSDDKTPKPLWWSKAEPLLSGMALGVAAGQREVREKKEASVFLRLGAKYGGTICSARWDMTDVKIEEDVPLWQAISDLESQSVREKPFQSKVLDYAIKALIKDVESDDKKEEPNKKYASFKKGVEFLSPQSGWFWFAGGFGQCFQKFFAHGAVRLALLHESIKNEQIQTKLLEDERKVGLLFEGFPVQSDANAPTPYWWKEAPYWWSDQPD